jgi:glucosamine 6-phosphate synthetase-like amidotransferase/phosphosugar isomerase protein
MTDKKYVLEHNCETGESVEREFTDEEYAQAEVDAMAYAAQKAIQEAEEAAKASAKASAEAKLKALGLSDAEIAALK